jgi:PAS domain S-box-containing protein
MSAIRLPAGKDRPEPVNILLVDDQPAKLLSYEVILADLGQTLLKATSPREALAQLLRADVAVVLMDVQMPELDGFELASMIREHPRFEKTAIIFVSAIHLTEIDRLKGYAAGAVDYLSVPIVPEVLRAKVNIFVELYRKTRQLERVNEELETRVRERTAELEASNRRLQASERRRSLALAAGSMGSWDWNTATGEMKWDAGQYKIFGVEEDAFSPTLKNVLGLIHPEDSPLLAEAIDRALTGDDLHLRFRILRADGSMRWCITSGTAAPDENGQLVHLTGVTYDVTEQTEAKIALERLNDELERRIEERTREREAALAQLFEAQKNEAIGQLTGGVAHDFNNLLMAVLGSLELLKKRVQEPRALRLVQNAFEGAQRGATLTKRLLAFARRQELKPQAVSLHELVEGMEDLLRRAVGPSVTIQSELAPHLAPVHADPNQLELALLNLAVNARDAMPEGGTFYIGAEEIAIDTDQPEGLARGPYVQITVSDTGAGMDQATLARATEPFFTTKGPGKGTGLGLSMVQGMVAQSGGTLRLRSTSGAGTRIDILLPTASLPLSRHGGAPAQDGADHLPAVLPLTILLVDDDDLVRSGAISMLEDLGHRVVEACSGEQALAALKRHDDIALLLTDHVMPGMKGLELIEHARRLRPRLGAILATGYAELHATEDVGDVRRLAKPFTQAELQRTIATLVEPRREAFEAIRVVGAGAT